MCRSEHSRSPDPDNREAPDTSRLIELISQQDLLEKAIHQGFSELNQRLDDFLLEKSDRSSYSITEAALLVNRSKYTVRKWCRNKRIRAHKIPKEW